MKSWIKSFVDFYIYSSLHISIGAALFSIELFLLLDHKINLWFTGLVFSSTLFVYSLHRVIGLNKLKSSLKTGRYLTIIKYKSHIVLYTLVSLVGLLFCLFQLEFKIWLLFIPAGLISILYTLPVFGKGKRLRDFNFVKIILIAFVWAYIASFLPMYLMDSSNVPLTWISFIEKFVFLLLITLPFDVRDLEIDQSLGVKTLPAVLGLPRTKSLINLLLILGCLLLGLIYFYDWISLANMQGLLAAYLLSLFAIYFVWNKRADYYYSGLLDGLLIVRGLIIVGLTLI